MFKNNVKYMPIAFAFIFIMTGCGTAGLTNAEDSSEVDAQVVNESIEATEQFFAMDTYMTITANGANAQLAVEECVEEVQRVEKLFSSSDENSQIGILNTNKSAVVDKEVFDLIVQSIELAEKTNQAFNISVYPLMKLWGFTTGDYRVPDIEDIEQTLSILDLSEILIDKEELTIEFTNKKMEIDLGGIAKGYASAQVLQILKNHNIESGMINLGGNVVTLGNKVDGSLWRVALQDPENPELYLGIIETKDNAVITSGGYERYFVDNEMTYHHILDPETGYPANNGITSVTIVSKDATLADGLSTAMFIMGRDRAIEYWQENREDFEMILYENTGILYVTEGILENFSSEGQIIKVERED
ncbi:MAG: FAD:protein FMN transferase [Suipraeoptans sp.]